MQKIWFVDNSKDNSSKKIKLQKDRVKKMKHIFRYKINLKIIT